MPGTHGTPALKTFCTMSDAERHSLLSQAANGAGNGGASRIKDLLLSLGDQLEKLVVADVVAANELAPLLEASAKESGLAEPLARIRRARAAALSFAGKFAESIALSRLSRDAAQVANEGVEAARALVTQMHPLLMTGASDAAVLAGEQARSELVALGQTLIAARVDINLANIHKALGRPAKALEHLDRAATELSSQPDMGAHISNARGESLNMVDRFEDARRAFLDALRHFGPEGGTSAAIVEGNIADVAAREGLFQEALERYASARAKLGDSAPAHAARLAVEEAEVLEILGVTDVAGARFAEGISKFEELGLPHESTRALVGAARVLEAQGDMSEAAAGFARAATHASGLGNSSACAVAVLQQASSLARAGKVKEARAALDSVNQGALSGPLDRALSHHHRSIVIEQEGKIVEALRESELAVEQTAVATASPLAAVALSRKAKLLRRSAKPTEATAVARRAVELVEGARSTLRFERMRAGLLARRLDAYEELVLSLVSAGTPQAVQEAFVVAERAKSRVLLDRMRQAVDDPQLSQSGPNADRLRDLRGRLDALYGRLADDATKGHRFIDPSAARDEITELERAIDLIEGENALLPGMAKFGVARSLVADGQLLMGAVSEGTALIEYFRAGGRWMAFVFVAGALRVVPLPIDDATLTSLLGRAGFQIRRALPRGDAIRNRQIQDVQCALSQLAEALWEPIVSLVEDCHRLVVVPHAALHSLPFHALHTSRGYLVESYEISYSPSSSVLVDLNHRLAAERSMPRVATSAAGARTGTLVVGVADLAAPCIEQEAANIASEISDATVLMGPRATRAAVCTELQRSERAHLACHGFFLPEAPRASGLKLADGWLTARDIAALSRTPRTVVLSGCETAVSAVREGDELLGLVGSFLGCSTSALVASLWSVQDAAAAEWMTEFHRSYLATDRRSVCQRVREASLAALERHPHPAHWASFVPIGAVGD